MTDPDAYRVLMDGPESELRIKGSRFIGQAFHAQNLECALAAVDAVRKRHHAATHHCWAARFGGTLHLEERYEDDGEPSGTAGVPILKPIAGRKLHDGLVVVTRYFGGVKLGTGGLARAYGDAAAVALDRAPVETVILQNELVLECSWEELGTVEAVLGRRADQVVAVRRDFGELPRFRVRVRRSAASALREELREASGGRILVSD